jgi:hypothetical protein
MKRGVAAELALLRKASAQERTVILLANPPGDLTRAFHEGLHHTTIAANPPQATRDKFAGFPLLIEGWNAREAGATAVLAQAMQTALCVRRRGPVGDPPELPPARFDKSIEAQARHEITLGTGEAEAGHTKIAILRFTAAIYTGYEACSISAMFDACAQLARWSETLSDPLAKDYRMLHQVFSIGTRHGLGAMAACFQGLLPNN